MKVFNACALVIRRRYAAFLIYLVIFTALSVVMTSMSVQQNDQTFNRTKTAVARRGSGRRLPPSPRASSPTSPKTPI